jgi:uroporphyrinogen-III synthase
MAMNPWMAKFLRGKSSGIHSTVAKFDSYFLYVLEEDELVLRASKNPHADVVDRLKLQVGHGIRGRVAEHKESVVLGRNAFNDPRFQSFNELPEDRFEAFVSVPLLSRDKLVGVINLQWQQPHTSTHREIRIISTIGFLLGAEIELRVWKELTPNFPNNWIGGKRWSGPKAYCNGICR